MAKRGGNKHTKRIASPDAIPLHDKKEYTWLIRTAPGPHKKSRAIPLGVVLRDVLKIVRTAKEAKRALSQRSIQIDGKVRTDEKFPVGLMDVVSIPAEDLHYRFLVDKKSRLVPVPVSKSDASSKLLKVTGKHTIRGKKINITFHDGKNMLSDNHVMIGDSIMVSLPIVKMSSHLKREEGSRCLVMEGKHAGTMVTLKKIIERKGGKSSEALVSDGSTEFVTVAKYLFVVDEAFQSAVSE